MSIQVDFERCECFTSTFPRFSWVVKLVSEYHPRFIVSQHGRKEESLEERGKRRVEQGLSDSPGEFIKQASGKRQSLKERVRRLGRCNSVFTLY